MEAIKISRPLYLLIGMLTTGIFYCKSMNFQCDLFWSCQESSNDSLPSYDNTSNIPTIKLPPSNQNLATLLSFFDSQSQNTAPVKTFPIHDEGDETIYCLMGGCGETFDSLEGIFDHFKKKHSYDFSWESHAKPKPSSLDQQNSTNSNKKMTTIWFFSCSCGNEQATYPGLTKHILNYHCDRNTKMFTCPVIECQETFDKALDTARHLSHDHKLFSIQSHRLIPYRPRKKDIKEANYSHHHDDVILVSSPLCEPSFCPCNKTDAMTKKALKEHIAKNHYHKRMFYCPACHLTFYNKKGLFKHLGQIHKAFSTIDNQTLCPYDEVLDLNNLAKEVQKNAQTSRAHARIMFEPLTQKDPNYNASSLCPCKGTTAETIDGMTNHILHHHHNKIDDRFYCPKCGIEEPIPQAIFWHLVNKEKLFGVHKNDLIRLNPRRNH